MSYSFGLNLLAAYVPSTLMLSMSGFHFSPAGYLQGPILLPWLCVNAESSMVGWTLVVGLWLTLALLAVVSARFSFRLPGLRMFLAYAIGIASAAQTGLALSVISGLDAIGRS